MISGKTLALGFALLAIVTTAANLQAEPETLPGFELELIHHGPPFQCITGMAVTENGDLMITDSVLGSSYGQLIEFDVGDRIAEVLHEGLPLSSPTSVVSGSGFTPFDFDFIITDANSQVEELCCRGASFGYDLATNQFHAITRANIFCENESDALDIAFPRSGSAFLRNGYILEYGDKLCPPHIWAINPEGEKHLVYYNERVWPQSSLGKRALDFSYGSDFGDALFVVDLHDGSKIWRITPDLEAEIFIEDDELGYPFDLAFSYSGFFGDNIYVLAPFPLNDWGRVLRISKDREISTVVSGLPAHPVSNAGHAFGALVFSPSYDVLYLGYGDLIFELKPTPAINAGSVIIDSVLVNEKNQSVINYTVVPHETIPRSGYQIRVLTAKQPQSQFDDITPYVSGDLSQPPGGGSGTIVWDVDSMPEGGLREEYLNKNLSVIFELELERLE